MNKLRVYQMGESALLVCFSNTISLASSRRVHALRQQLERQALPGLLDLVPAYSSLLIRFDPLTLGEDHLRDIISRLDPDVEHAGDDNSQTHVLKVRYGGDDTDLTSLSQTARLDEREVARLHARQDYYVHFLGFMPGFAYMGTVPRQIAAPRLATPRVRVPAGAVGIADDQTGIYPFASPGGWNIVGRTDAPLWDPYGQRPALLAAGDMVRFVETDSLEDLDPVIPPPINAERPVFRVTGAAGAFTTIQDQGRPGFGSVGLSWGGAMDRSAMSQANALVGNPVGSAVLEMTYSGPELYALRTTTISLAGADFECFVDGLRVPPGLSWLVREGSTVRFRPSSSAPRQARAYLAIAGGIDVPLVLGSRSTYPPAAFGGYAGRALNIGDVLEMGISKRSPVEVAGRFANSQPREVRRPAVLHFTRFAGQNAASDASIEALAESTWSVMEQTNRMGTRLSLSEGKNVVSDSKPLISFGVVRGAIQLPPDGNPVILSADHQTTGGYPMLGVVAEVDWGMVAQLVPGDAVSFREVSVAEARQSLSDSRRNLARFAP